jgi:hypothetical protein
MKRTLLFVLSMFMLLALSAPAFAAGPAGYESDTGDWTGWDGTLPRTEIDPASPASSGTTSTPTGTSTSTDPYTVQNDQADASTTAGYSVTYYGCQTATSGVYSNTTKVVQKTCIQRRSDNGHKRLKSRVTCWNPSMTAKVTCHHWWSQDPKGHTAYYRMYSYDSYSKTWDIEAYSDVRGPALNVTESVAYSQWACDLSSRWIQARRRNLGITVHGGTYFYPWNKDSAQVWDSAASLDPYPGC